MATNSSVGQKLSFIDCKRACEHMTPEGVEILIKAGLLDVNIKDDDGDSILSYKGIKIEIFKLFISHGFDLLATNKSGVFSYSRKTKLIADVLKEHPRVIDFADTAAHGHTLLHHTNYYFLKVLIERPAEYSINLSKAVNMRNGYGDTPLHIFAANDRVDRDGVSINTILELLVPFNPDYSIKNNDLTPMDYCVSALFKELYNKYALRQENDRLKAENLDLKEKITGITSVLSKPF